MDQQRTYSHAATGAAENHLTLVTRKSPLALKQTEMARAYLQNKMPEWSFAILPMVTSGDRQQQWSLEHKGGKGLFTKELEDALLSGRADMAVHSAKDLPTTLPQGLKLAGFLPRAEAGDVLIVREHCPQPQRIATGSPRRREQGRRLFPSAQWVEIRGNVETRLGKVADGEVDATFLARAGLQRLGISSWPGVSFRALTVEEMVPAVAQGAIGLEVRSADCERYRPLFCEETAWGVGIEREFLHLLGGGCQTAVGAYYCAGLLRVFHADCGPFSIDLTGLNRAAISDRMRRTIAEKGLFEDA